MPCDLALLKKEWDNYVKKHGERDHYNTRPQKDPQKKYPSAYLVVDNPHCKEGFNYFKNYLSNLTLPVVETKICRNLAGYKVPLHIDTFHGIKIYIPLIIPEPGQVKFRIHKYQDCKELNKWDMLSEDEFPVVEEIYQYEGLCYWSHGKELHSVTAPPNKDRVIVQIYLDPKISKEEFLRHIKDDKLFYDYTASSI